MDSDYIADVFGPHGALAQGRPGYQPREGQITLARAVDGAIRDTSHVLIEAPTGTGKTIGYAVPAIYHAVRSDKRVLIVTANIALQQQIVNEDLPQLSKTLSWPFAFELLKGRNNYVCIDRVKEEEARGVEWFDESEHDYAKDVMEWSYSTETGDIAELTFEMPRRVRARLTVMSDQCDGARCPHVRDCFAERAKSLAKKSHVVVTNYYMLFLHLLSGDRILPPFDVAILDEAHLASDIAREVFGFDVKLGSIRHAVQLLRELGRGTQGDAIYGMAKDMFAELSQLMETRRVTGQLRLTKPNEVAWSALVEGLTYAAGAFNEQASATNDADETLRWIRASEEATALATRITDVMTVKNSPSVVYIVQQDERKNMSLAARLLDVAPVLKEQLFREDRTVILTSATLRTNDKFDYIARETGIDTTKAATFVVPTPFDWMKQAIMVVPPNTPKIPLPEDKRFDAWALDCVRYAIKQAQGRTLCLFTSWKRLKYAQANLGDIGFRVLVQGGMERGKIVEAFRSDVSSVLLATGSFWAGIDIPGEALSCLVIDKLPFESGDDPIASAYEEIHKDAFIRRFVPRAIVTMNQGLGRLIRRTTDTGVVVLLDKRIHHKGYGVLFRKSLPPGLRVVESLAEIGPFLDAARRAETH